MLKIDKLTIRFGGLVAVSDLSFEIRQGQIFGLIGPNGAGKTTCFNMISGTYPPTSGAIEFLGRRIDGLPMFRINALGIARTYQNINLFGSMTILENVMVGQHSRGACGLPSSILRLPKQKAEERRIIEKAEEVLGFVGLSGKEKERADSLAYGEQRLLEIARALSSDPKLILLDEPAAGMNPSEKMQLMQLVFKIRDMGVTVLVVEHDMRFVMNLVDEICVLNYGKKLALGTPKEVQANPEVLEAYLGGD